MGSSLFTALYCLQLCIGNKVQQTAQKEHNFFLNIYYQQNNDVSDNNVCFADRTCVDWL